MPAESPTDASPLAAPHARLRRAACLGSCGLVALLWVGAVGCERQGPPRQGPAPYFAYAEDGQYLERRAGPGLIDAPDSPIPDVPVPMGFKGLPSKSVSTALGATRSVDHTYQGRALLDDLNTFYRYRLWQNGWRITDADTAPRQLRITAVKGEESLEIDASARHDIVTMRVLIGPPV